MADGDAPGLRVYGLPYSPYCVKVHIALRFKRLAFEQIEPPGGYRSTAYRKMVPTGTIPALDLGSRILFESNAIIEYLDGEHPDPPLLPADPVERANARAAAAYHDTRVEPVIRTLFPQFYRKHMERLVFTNAAGLLRDRLERLEEMLPERRFIAGGFLSVGDLGFPWTLTMAVRLFKEMEIDLAYSDRVQGWLRRLREIAAVDNTLAEAGPGLDAWLDEKRREREAMADS